MRKSSHMALYGNIVIPRVFCSECDSYGLVVDDIKQCCERPAKTISERTKRISDCPIGRNIPKKKVRDFILETQSYRCFYCWRRFGQTVFRESRSIRLKIAWDHVNPYVYSLDNRNSNFVASCQICNGIKSSLIFKDADEARIHITERWKDKHYSDMPPMSIELHAYTPVAEVLSEDMSSNGVVQ